MKFIKVIETLMFFSFSIMNHHVLWENPLFLWPFSSSQTVSSPRRVLGHQSMATPGVTASMARIQPWFMAFGVGLPQLGEVGGSPNYSDSNYFTIWGVTKFDNYL